MNSRFPAIRALVYGIGGMFFRIVAVMLAALSLYYKYHNNTPDATCCIAWACFCLFTLKSKD